MAIVRATKSGNYSDVTVWNTGALPTNADTVWSNTYTVTIDMDLTGSNAVISLNNGSTTGVTVGGGYTLSHASGTTRTITADLNSNSTNSGLITHSGTGTVVVNGNVNISASGNAAYLFSAAGTLTVNGNVSITSVSTGTLGINLAAIGATVTVNGNVTGGTALSQSGVNSTGGATITVTGTCKGGTGSNAHGLNATGANAIIDLQGQVEAGSGGAGAYCLGPTNVRVKGPLIHHAGTSRAPLVATHWAVKAGQNTTYVVRDDTAYPAGGPVTLTNYVSNSPAPANVRAGTVYGPSNNLTGTMVIPAASNVASGVAVDNTTGTSVINGSSLSNIVGSQIQAGMNQ